MIEVFNVPWGIYNITKAKELVSGFVYEIDIKEHLPNIEKFQLSINDFHLGLVDIDEPGILSYAGWLIDGWHRLLKSSETQTIFKVQKLTFNQTQQVFRGVAEMPLTEIPKRKPNAQDAAIEIRRLAVRMEKIKLETAEKIAAIKKDSGAAYITHLEKVCGSECQRAKDQMVVILNRMGAAEVKTALGADATELNTLLKTEE